MVKILIKILLKNFKLFKKNNNYKWFKQILIRKNGKKNAIECRSILQIFLSHLMIYTEKVDILKYIWLKKLEEIFNKAKEF